MDADTTLVSLLLPLVAIVGGLGLAAMGMWRQMRLKALLEVWLYVHVPLTIMLLAALTAHIVSVFYYW